MSKFRNFISILCVVFCCGIVITLVSANSPDIEWQRCLGGSQYDNARSIQQTADRGYIVAGSTWSNDVDVIGNHGCSDVWVVKLDSAGSIVWQQCLGGSTYDNGFSIQQTVDGGYILAGHSFSDDGDVTDNHGNYDAWVVKMDSIGGIIWQRCLGGSDFDEATFIQQTADSGYIFVGETSSNDGDVTGNRGGTRDAWIVKLEGSGVSGDLNGNGIIDWGDVVKCAYMSWGMITPEVAAADFNSNGIVDWGDVVKLAYYYWGKIPAL